MIRVYIVDDEPPARNRLKKMLSESDSADDIDIVGEASDGVEAVEFLSSNHADIVLLDIQMPGYDGFEVLDRLSPDQRPVIIFTTAYDEYALRAFDANAVDYLLKPITTERLDTAVARASELIDKPDSRQSAEEDLARLLDWMDAKAGAGSPPDAMAAPATVYLDKLTIPYRDRILIVPVERLVSIEISEGITRVHILDDEETGPRPRLKQHIVNYTLDQLASLLDPAEFIRVHRSAIVQFSQIKELVSWFSGRYKLVLTGNHEVIASRERSKLLKERLKI